MGCFLSSNQTTNGENLKKQKSNFSEYFLFGQNSFYQSVFYIYDYSSKIFIKKQIPINIKLKNYSSMVPINSNSYLICGGINYSASQISSNVYLYQSSKHQFSVLQNMSQCRYTHTSIKLSNYIYVIGGRIQGEDHEAILNKCQKYDIVNKKWLQVSNMNKCRCTCLSILWNDCIYVLGGYTGPSERSTLIEKLNIQQKWQIISFQLHRGIEGFTALSMSNNELTIFGGNINYGITDSIITLNFAKETIKYNSKMNEQKTLHKQYNNLIFSSTKYTIEQYNKDINLCSILSENNKIEQLQNLTQLNHNIIIEYKQQILQQQYKINLNHDIIYIIGTIDKPMILQLNLSIPSTNTLSMPSMMKLYAQQGGIWISNYELLLFGGAQEQYYGVSNQVYKHNIQNNTIKKMSPMLEKRYAFAYNKINMNIYVCGGSRQDKMNEEIQIILNQCQCYNIDTNEWKNIASLPKKLISAMSIVYNQQLYIIGGLQQNGQRNCNIYKYKEGINNGRH